MTHFCRHLSTLATAYTRDGDLKATRCEDCGGEFLVIIPSRGRGQLIPFTAGHALPALRVRERTVA